MSTINWSIQHWVDTAANFTANNPILLSGQLAIESDGLTTAPKFKIGDGTTDYNTLPYASASAVSLAAVLAVGASTLGNSIKVNNGDFLLLGDLNVGALYYDSASQRVVLSSASGQYIYFNDTGTVEISHLPVNWVASPTAGTIGMVPNKYIIRQHATYTLTNTTNVQKLFNGSANGEITLPVGTYKFTCFFRLTGMDTSGMNNAAFSIEGTAVTGNFLMRNVGIDTAPTTGPFNLNGGFAITKTFAASMQTGSLANAMASLVEGTFEVTTAGTIIPSIKLVVGAAAVESIGSYFEIECWGLDTVVTVGPWS